MYRSWAAGASRDEERANPAEKAASCAKVTELREKCGKTKKADENAREKKKKNLRTIVQMRKHGRETSIKNDDT